MSFLSSIAPVLGTGLGALFAAPTGGMSMGMGALIGGMAGSGVGSAMAADEANKTNVDLTRETNATQIELANTAHQREMADLRAAGLNPILSAKYGGASTPSLTSPTVQSLAPIIQNSANQVATTAMGYQNLQADIAVKKSSVLANSAQAANAGQEARRRAMENDLLETEIENRRYVEKRRYERNPWLKNLGIDIGDTLSTGGRFLSGMFK